jgi:hypothetical protein
LELIRGGKSHRQPSTDIVLKGIIMAQAAVQRNRSLLILALLATLLLPVASPAQDTLRWKFSAGEQLALKVVQEVDMETAMFDQPIKMTTNMEMELGWTVESVDEQGVANVTLSVDRVKIGMAAPGMDETAYDSASDEDPTGNAMPLATSIEPILGVEIQQKMNERGEVMDVSLSQEAEKAFAKLPGGSRYRQIFSKSGLKQISGQAGMLLPEAAVSKGDAWTQESETTLPMGKSTATVKYTYEGREAFDEKTLDKISVALTLAFGNDGKVTMKTGAGDVEAIVRVKEQNNTGHMLFDREAGRFVETVMNQQLTLETAFGETKMEQRVSSTTTVTIAPAAEELAVDEAPDDKPSEEDTPAEKDAPANE